MINIFKTNKIMLRYSENKYNTINNYFINTCYKKNKTVYDYSLFHEKFHLEYLYPDGEYSLAENLTTGRKKQPNKQITLMTIIIRKETKHFRWRSDCRVGGQSRALLQMELKTPQCVWKAAGCCFCARTWFQPVVILFKKNMPAIWVSIYIVLLCRIL